MLILVLVVLSGMACAAKRAEPAAGLPEQEPFDWSTPFGGQGVVLLSPANLTSDFPLQVPSGSLGIAKVFVPPNKNPSGKVDAVFFVLTDPTYGIVWIGESGPDVSDDAQRLAGFKETVAENGQPGRRTTAELVTIRGGTPALLGLSSGGTTLQWVEKGTQFNMMGPTITRDQMLKVAESI